MRRECVPPLGKMLVDVHDVVVDVNLCDVLLDIMHFVVPIFDV